MFKYCLNVYFYMQSYWYARNNALCYSKPQYIGNMNNSFLCNQALPEH